MNLSSEDVSYLRAFEEEMHKSDSCGWLDCGEAAKRHRIDAKGGKLAVRLTGMGYLEQKKKGHPEFRITPSGVQILLPWWRRNLTLISVVVAILGVITTWVAILKR